MAFGARFVGQDVAMTLGMTEVDGRTGASRPVGLKGLLVEANDRSLVVVPVGDTPFGQAGFEQEIRSDLVVAISKSSRVEIAKAVPTPKVSLS
jgi:hypothetical protein